MHTGFLTREKSFAYLSITSHMLPTSWDPESHLREGSCRQRGCREQRSSVCALHHRTAASSGQHNTHSCCLPARTLCLAKPPSPFCQPKLSVKTEEWFRLGIYRNTGAVPP